MNAALYMELLEAARASELADRLGHDDPMTYIRAALTRHGQLAPDDTTPAQILALCPDKNRGIAS